jgi:hypothetical protein
MLTRYDKLHKLTPSLAITAHEDPEAADTVRNSYPSRDNSQPAQTATHSQASPPSEAAVLIHTLHKPDFALETRESAARMPAQAARTVLAAGLAGSSRPAAPGASAVPADKRTLPAARAAGAVR